MWGVWVCGCVGVGVCGGGCGWRTAKVKTKKLRFFRIFSELECAYSAVSLPNTHIPVLPLMKLAGWWCLP